MNEEESISTYFVHVDEIVNTIRGLGEYIKEIIIVQKVLRSLPSIFDLKIYTIEEIKDIKNMKMDEFHGILNAYEMRIEKDKQENTLRKEAIVCWLWSLFIFLIRRSCFSCVWTPLPDEGVWGGFPPTSLAKGVECGKQ
jgi:hypothetical protein